MSITRFGSRSKHPELNKGIGQNCLSLNNNNNNIIILSLGSSDNKIITQKRAILTQKLPKVFRKRQKGKSWQKEAKHLHLIKHQFGTMPFL